MLKLFGLAQGSVNQKSDPGIRVNNSNVDRKSKHSRLTRPSWEPLFFGVEWMSEHEL